MTAERSEILLVEDDSNDIASTLHAFKTANIANTIHVARDGVEALERIFGNGAADVLPNLPKVILLDLNMPRLDGHQVA